jgi:methyl-accepting chemotaxis protein
MYRWNSISVKSKFLASIFIIFVLSILSAVFSIFSIQELDESAKLQDRGAKLSQSLIEREVQHLQWVNALSNYLVAPDVEELKIARDPTLCGFGKWYYSIERKAAERLFPATVEAFKAIEQPHRDLHATAEEIEKLVKAGDVAGARRCYREKTLSALSAVRARFIELRKAVDAGLEQHQQATERTAELSRNRAIIAGAVICLTVLALCVILFSNVLKPLEYIARYSKDCIENRDAVPAMKRRDEFGMLADNLSELMRHLNKELAFSRGVLQGICVPCSVFSPEDRTVFTNRQMVELLERSGTPDDYRDTTSGEYIWNEKGRETISTRALRRNEAVTEEMDFTTHAGNVRRVLISSAPFHDRAGAILGTLSIWIDLTELSDKQKAVEESARRIAEIAMSAQGVADGVSTAAADISVQVEQSGRGAATQLDRITETAAAMTQMNQAVMEVARNAGQASDTAAEARQAAQEGADVVEHVVKGIGAVEKYAGGVKEGMGRLGAQADGIGKIIDVINDIADQTNLLALNAAIEAARAGEAGRGFAVVADEVRKLAEKTMEATKEVGTVIRGIQGSTHDNIRNVDLAAAAVAETIELAVRAGQNLQSIVVLVDNTAGQVQAIATAAEEQSAGSNEINRAVVEISRISGETDASMRAAASAVELLVAQANSLRELIRSLRA